jgi:hypothetical protein
MVSKKVLQFYYYFLFGCFFRFYYLGASKIGVGSENSEKTTKLEEINIKNCYLVQTDFKSYRTSITSRN